jgi:NitT/TauT family transport system ATP-binding protein
MKLIVENLAVAFERRDDTPLTVLGRVSFEVQPGEFVSLVGPSGCGKTTVLRCLGGLQAPSGGTISIAERPLRGTDKRVAMVFQSDSLFPWRTVVDNVAFGLEVRKYARRQIAERVRDLIELVGLTACGSG